MQMPGYDAGTERLINIGDYHYSMLSACDETSEIATTFLTFQEKLKAAFNTRRAAGTNVTIAMAKRDYADLLLDNMVRKVEAVILAEVNKNRQVPQYKKLFPKGLGAIVYSPFEEEITLVKQLEENLKEIFPAVAQNYVSLLTASRQRFETSLAAFKEQINIEANAFAEEKKARIDWLTQYKKNYGKLIDMFPGQKQFYEGFFLKHRTTSKDESEQENNPQ